MCCANAIVPQPHHVGFMAVAATAIPLSEGRLRGLLQFALSAVSVLWQQWPNMGIVHGSFAVPFLPCPLLMPRCGEYGRRCTLCAVLTPLYHSRITLASWLWPQRPYLCQKEGSVASCNSPFLPCQCCGSSGPTWESCMAALQCLSCHVHCSCHDVVSMAVAARCVLC